MSCLPCLPASRCSGSHACTVIMCADVLVYNLDQWRSSDSSTDINITIFNFKEGQLTLLTHILHRALSVSSETWSCGCHVLFRRAAVRRDWTHDARAIVKRDGAREDAVQFRLQTAARRCARAAERVCGSDCWSQKRFGFGVQVVGSTHPRVSHSEQSVSHM